jgi:hypothetical protein
MMYSVVTYLHGHQGSHLVAIKTGKATLNPIFVVPLVIYNWLFLPWLFLAWLLAYKIVWQDAAIFFGAAFIFRLIWTKVGIVTGAIRSAWALSLLGIPAIPILFICMVRLTLSATDTNSLLETCRRCAL